MNASVMRRAGLTAAMVVTGLISIGLFTFGWFQISNQETAVIPSIGTETISCDQAPYGANRPFSFTAAGANQAYYCSWSWINDSLRFVISLAGGLYVFPAAYFALWRKMKSIMYLHLGLCFAMIIGVFAVMCIDANSIRVSTSWCDGGLDGAQPFQKVDVDCDYWWYIFMTFADAVAVVFWGLLFGVSAWYARVYMTEDFTNWDFNFSDEEHRLVTSGADHYAASSSI